MFVADFSWDNDLFDAWLELSHTAPRTVETFVRGDMKHFLQTNINEQLVPYPPVPVGSTYIRTFNLQRSWKVTISLGINAASMGIGNTADYATYVIGEKQQGFHAANGWPFAPDVGLNIIIEAMDVLADAWFDIVEFKTLI